MIFAHSVSIAQTHFGKAKKDYLREHGVQVVEVPGSSTVKESIELVCTVDGWVVP